VVGFFTNIFFKFSIYRKNKSAIFIYKLDPKEKEGNKGEIWILEINNER
jgi:hypothetical protein